jgi:hypothetical protein
LKTFVDNIAIQVVEATLIGDLWSIFSPADVGQMSSELIARISAESTESQALRQQLDRKLRILEKGMEICQRYSVHTSRNVSHMHKDLRDVQDDQDENDEKPQSNGFADDIDSDPEPQPEAISPSPPLMVVRTLPENGHYFS